jgi:glycosyltransferase involved in cell wall biosynthesis
MKILMLSLPFSPLIGGTVTVSEILAAEFARAGHEVRVITETSSGNSTDEQPYKVLRCVPQRVILREVKWCDVFFHNSISMRNAWPLLLVRKPWVIAQHTYLFDGKKSVRSRIKLAAFGAAKAISISSVIADHLETPSVMIGNPYDDRLFRLLPEIDRQKDLVFVGNLGRIKGAHVLLDALARLRDRGFRVNLTIVGGGEEQQALERMTNELGLADAVTFKGPLRGEHLVREFNRHAIQIIPSLIAEPFGVVAIEGIACGCVPIGTEAGGLKDAIGPCGMVVPNGDAEALAQKIEYALTTADLSAYRAQADVHLRKHRGEEVAAAYLRVFESAIQEMKN